MAKTRHRSTTPGKRVVLVLKDGTRVAGRFDRSNDREIYLREGLRVSAEDLRTMIVVKGER